MPVTDARILILCKTYPSPSGKYTETSCVAGMDENGNLVRLFPVPFRLITKEQQFKKWQWISAKVEKARGDHRSESLTIKVDTIEGDEVVSPERDWAERRRLISMLNLYTHFAEIDTAQKAGRLSLALLKPGNILGLDIVPVANPNWTEEELLKLEQEQKQGGLFDNDDKPAIRRVQKLPFDFYYRYECGSALGQQAFRHKIVDWEAGALYWNCRRSYGDYWEHHFRQQLEVKLPSADLMFLMGNIHRFQDQWLIISLIYPPHQKQGELAF